MTNLKTGGYVAGILLALVVGFYLGIVAVNWGSITFDGHVSAGAGIRMLTTIITAIIVSLFFQRLIQVNRKEKELIISQLALMLDLVGELEELRDSEDPVALVNVNTILKKLRVKSTFVKKAIVECSFGKKLNQANSFSDKIAEIRDLTTHTPSQRVEDFVESERCPIYVREGLVTWMDERKRVIELKLDALKNEIFAFQLRINRV
jgi:hypothetical protein